MIIDGFLKLIVFVLDFIVGLLPDLSFNMDLSGPIDTLANVIAWVDVLIPIEILTGGIALMIIVDNFGYIVKVISFIWSKIPFIGG